MLRMWNKFLTSERHFGQEYFREKIWVVNIEKKNLYMYRFSLFVSKVDIFVQFPKCKNLLTWPQKLELILWKVKCLLIIYGYKGLKRLLFYDFFMYWNKYYLLYSILFLEGTFIILVPEFILREIKYIKCRLNYRSRSL